MSHAPQASPANRTLLLGLPQVPPSRSKSEQQVTLALAGAASDLESGERGPRAEAVASALDIPSQLAKPPPPPTLRRVSRSPSSSPSSLSASSALPGRGELGAEQAPAVASSPRESRGLLDQFQTPNKAPRRGPRASAFINPSGSVCYWWSAVVSLAFLYNFWAASYRFAFSEMDADSVYIWLPSDLAADLIYIVDIVINRKTAYLEDGVLQRDSKKIRVHYLESNLLYLDCFCLLPFDVLHLSFGFNSIFRCNRLVKIYKFWSFVDRTERHTNYPNVFRTSTLVHNILVIFHWNACIFHMISTHKIIDIEGLHMIDAQHCKDTSCQYLHAFYWSTLAIIGNLPRPKTRGEYIYVIAELIFGLILFAWVLGHVANIVTNVSAARKEFQARLDAVKTFMRTRRVSEDLQTKVIRWFDYLWSSQKSSDEERSVACLPDRLKAEIAIHVNLDTLKRVDIFQETEVGFLRELVLRLKPVLFSPGDYVCRKDEAGHEMYIVSRGILEVVTNEGKTVVATFTAGSYFGEIAVLNVGAAGNKRTASVRSVGYSDLFCLSKRDLWDVLKDYPLAEARIRAVAEERLSALGGRGGKGARPQQRPSGTINDDGDDDDTGPNGASTSLRPPASTRRLSQRSNRSRVQPVQAAPSQSNSGKHYDCFMGPFPLVSPAAFRAHPHRSCQAGGLCGSQLLGRKRLNSRTMEPICGAYDPRPLQAGLLARPRLPVRSEPASEVHHCHHHCHQTAACSLHCSGGNLLEPAPARQADMSGQPALRGRPGRAAVNASYLAVQQAAQLGPSRSFECSPLGLGGDDGRDELPSDANRSRSGASPVATRTTPPTQTSDDTQTLLVCQTTGSLDGSSSQADQESSAAAANRQSMHKPHLCLRHFQRRQQHQHHFNELSPTCRSSPLELARSNSMTARPAYDELADDHLSCDDGDYDDEDFNFNDEPDANKTPAHSAAPMYKWPPGDSQPALGAGPVPGRRQRHRRDCRRRVESAGQAGRAGLRHARQLGDSSLMSSSSTATLAGARPPYGNISGQLLGDLARRPPNSDSTRREPATSARTANCQAQLVVAAAAAAETGPPEQRVQPEPETEPGLTTSGATRWSSQSATGGDGTQHGAAVCLVDMGSEEEGELGAGS